MIATLKMTTSTTVMSNSDNVDDINEEDDNDVKTDDAFVQ